MLALTGAAGAESINVSNSPATQSTNPQIATDAGGNNHVAWTEGSEILYSRCEGQTCSAPLRMSEITDLACAAGAGGLVQDSATLAADGIDNLMAVWQLDDGLLLYRLLACRF